MASILKLRRGNSSQNDSFTGANGEITYDYTNKTIRVHDGLTAGGIRLAKNSERDDNLSVANATVLFADKMQVANTIALANSRLGKTSTVTLTGDITASSTAFSANAVSLSTTLSNSGVTAASYGSAALIPVFTVDAKGRITTATTASVAGVTSVTYYGANSTLRIATADGTNFDTSISTNDKLEVANATVLFNDRMQVANTVSLVNTKLANTNSYIAAVSATERSALANTNTYIATKANLASPTLTGTPVAPTAANTTNTTQIATTAFVQTAIDLDIAALANSAPVTLNTLNELAAALGDDANFATTLTTNLGQKLGSAATVTLNGDVSGTSSFSANAVTITTVIADDSHNHIIGNVDGLQTDLDTRATWSGLTGTNTAIRTLVSDRMQVANTTLLVNDRMQVANVTTALAGKLSTSGGTISGHLIPGANVTYDLGSATSSFRDLYLSGSTVTLGGVQLQDSSGSLIVKDTSTNNEVKLSSSLGVIIAGKTVIDSSGNLDSDQTGRGFTDSTVYVMPSGNLEGDDAYIGETAGSADPFGVALGTTFNMMEPIGSSKSKDLGTL